MKYFILFISLVITINLNAQLFGGMIISNVGCKAVTDYDANTYDVVDINGQCWITENLKTTHYNDGTAIPKVTDGTTWSGLTTGAYTYYNNDSSTYAPDYGALYNWYAVETGKLCPTGWHVPTDAEWTVLTDYLGGESVAGGKLKEVGTVHWLSPNTGATDEVGFTALPGGYRYVQFNDIGRLGIYWRDNRDSSISYDTRFYYNFTYTNKGTSSNITGYSVRCLKD